MASEKSFPTSSKHITVHFQEGPLGVTLRRRNDDGVVYIHDIVGESQAVTMDLEIGDELWSVGAKFVGLTPLNKEAWAELVKFIKDSPRPLEVGWRRKQYSRPQSAEQPTDASAQETAVPQETEVRQASTTSEDVAAAYAKSLQEAANRVDDSDGDSDYGDGHIRRSEEAYSHTKEAAGEVSSGKSTERNSQDQATEVASSQENAFTLSTPATPQQETAPDIKAIATEECASEGGEEEKGEEDDHKEMIEVFVQKLVFAESAKSPSPGFMQRKLSANSPSNSSKSSKRPPQVDMILNGRRRFIREGPIQTETKGALWASNHKKYVFLLTGLLILTTPKDNKYLVDMIFELPTCKVDSHLHVDPNGVSSSVEYALKSFEFHSPSGVYKFVCSEPTEKEGWVSLIIDAIYQCVVNAEEPVLGWRHQYALGTLHAAVISRDVVKVREYLHRHVANGEKNVDEVDEDGYTALHYACILRLHSIIRALYDFDPDITVSDRRGYTALHWAAMQLDYETIELISQRLYSADMYDLEGRTPLLLACVEGRTISGHSDPIALAKCVSRLVTLQADPNVRDQSGVSVIHYLAASWQYEALKLLLDAKADIYVTSDADSLNALHYAVLARSLRHSEGLASSLLSSANSSMRIGTSSKENSKKEGDDMLESDTLDFERAAPTIATFLKAGGRPNSREGNGKSALHILAEREGVWKGNIGRIVITLLEGGARLDDTPGCALIKSRFTEMGCAAELDAAMEKWNSKPVLNADSAEFEANCLEGSDQAHFCYPMDGVTKCILCSTVFTLFLRQHHCRLCNVLCCDYCSKGRATLKGSQVRVCDSCYTVTQTCIDTIRENNLKSAVISSQLVTSATPTKASEVHASDKAKLLSGATPASDKKSNKDPATAKAQGGLSDTMNTLGETKDMLLQRGEKLNELSEKTAQLNDSASEFAKLAKQLNEQQKNRWF